MNKIYEKLNISKEVQKATATVRKPVFDHIKDTTYPMGGYNFMADLLILPTEKFGYKYLLVIVDIWSGTFDMEPMKTKTAQATKQAFLNILKRKYINENNMASIRTDSGSEFKGQFFDFLKSNNILHRPSIPGRHKQLSKIDNLIRTISKFINGYMNQIEYTTKKRSVKWLEMLEIVRVELNKINKIPDGNPYSLKIYDKYQTTINKKQKFKVNDIVIRKLDHPQNMLGKNQNTPQFRTGDLRWEIHKPRKIMKVLTYPNNTRYLIEGLRNVSFTEKELRKQ